MDNTATGVLWVSDIRPGLKASSSLSKDIKKEMRHLYDCI